MKKDYPSSLELGSDTLEVVKTFKYLGHMLDCSLYDDSDIEMRLNKFYASSNSILRNFPLVNNETKSFLFKSYSMPDYGLSLWNHSKTFHKSVFNVFNVAYNNVLKKIIGAPSYCSSHAAAELCGVLLLNHRVALLQARYFKRILKTNNSLIKTNIPFLKKGFFFPAVTSFFPYKL